MERVRLHDKVFLKSIPYGEIEPRIEELARRINADYGDKDIPVFLCILNGAFMFAAELLKKIDFACEVSFVKLASYSGVSSAGNVSELLGLTGPLAGRHVVVLEDIVEKGDTIEAVNRIIAAHNPSSVSFATLFFKPEAYTKNIKVDYYAMELPNDFIVGFGLDYDQLGRNLKDIYTLESDE